MFSAVWPGVLGVPGREYSLGVEPILHDLRVLNRCIAKFERGGTTCIHGIYTICVEWNDIR